VFESGAILLYLAEKTGRFLPTNLRGRKTVIEWLFWQVGGLGPMAGQSHHFAVYAPEKIPYAIDRYVQETNRLDGVMDRRLAGRRFLAGDEYSIADMAPYPWVVPWKRQQQNLDDFVNLRRWFDCIHDRPGTRRGFVRRNARGVWAMLASGHEQPVPVFQQLARSDPSGRYHVRAIPTVAAQRRGSLGRARDRHQP
jgi:GST-like protein